MGGWIILKAIIRREIGWGDTDRVAVVQDGD
jgi:hypothetical protein